MGLLTRFVTAVLTVPLYLCTPALRISLDRERRARLLAARAAADAQAAPPAPVLRAPQISGSAMRVMRNELRAELAIHAANGRDFVHLARFERKFSQAGVRAVDEVPIDQLRRALADFEAMVRNWSSASLADLRSRMAVGLAERSSASSVWIAVNSIAPTYRNVPETMAARLARGTANAFRASGQLSVGEISLSHFEAAGGRTTAS
ncbi:MAG: hypothetical protein ABI281_03890 [Caldimonas sp.]